MSRKSTPAVCVCDLIYGEPHTDCEPSSAYICRLKSAGCRPANFRLNGTEVDRESAIDAACRMLRSSRYPLITGLDSLGTRSQQLAVDIGQEIGAIIDVGLVGSGCGSTLSMPRAGAVTATIGQVCAADGMVLVLGCDPAQTHPRFFRALMNGRPNERLVVIGLPDNHSILEQASFLQVADDELEGLVLILDSICRQQGFRRECLPVSVALEDLELLAQKILAEQHVVVLAGDGPSKLMDEFDSLPDSICGLVTSLNQFVRTATINLRSDGNGLGAEQVLLWSTGFPCAVDATREVARSCGWEHTTQRVLGRGEADFVLCFDVDSRGFAMLDPNLQQQVGKLPQIHFFAAGNDLVDEATTGPDKLQIANLNVLDDDFVRLDELAFSVASAGSSRVPNDRLNLCQFLETMLWQLRSGASGK